MIEPFTGIKEISTDLLEPDPNQPRLEKNPEDQANLNESVGKWSIWHPLLITKKPEQSKYQIVAGEGRFMAARNNQLLTVPCRFVCDPTKAEILRVQLEENLIRADFTVYEKTRGVLLWETEELGLTHAELRKLHYRYCENQALSKLERTTIESGAKMLRLSVIVVYKKCFDLLEVKPDIKQALEQRRLAYTTALLLDTINDDEIRAATLAKVVAGELSHKRVEEMIRSMRAKNRKRIAPRAKKVQKDFEQIAQNYLNLSDEQRIQIENHIMSMLAIIKTVRT
jgi:ParB family transcriptional regulator, chromosome partitioning protein